MLRRTLHLALVLAALHSEAVLGGSMPGDDPVPDSIGCSYSFTSSSLKWCVNEDGNLQQFESPAGANHLSTGSAVEGYYLCIDGQFGDTLVFADTAAQDLFTMGPPQLLAGPTASSVTIRRSTLNGRWQLDQKWTRDSAERDLTLTMTLENLGPQVTGARLARVIDINANGLATGNFYDYGRYSAVFRNVDTIAITALTLNQSPEVEISTNAGITFCEPTGAVVPGVTGNPKAYVIYDFGTLNTGAKKVVKIGYRAM
jgi:hypothetical protein